MSLNKLFTFIFISTLFASTLSNESWDEYESKSEVEMLAEVQGDIHALYSYPPYICHALHEVQEKINIFVTKYESYYRKNRSFVFKIINFIFFDKDQLNKNYYVANFDLKDYFYKFKMLKADNSESVNKLDSSELNLHDSQVQVNEHDSLLRSISDPKNKGKYDKYRTDDQAFNYYLIGKTFASTLWDKNFMCFSVQDLSLLIFRIFNYGFLDTKYIKRFFNGFYDGLYAETSDPAENLLRGFLLEQFFTYNLQVMLNFDKTTAGNLVKVFDHRQNQEELNDLITEFSTLYAYIIREVKVFWLGHNGSMKSYVRQYQQNPKLFFENVGRNASVYLSIYGLRYLKGMILHSATTFGAILIDDQFREVTNQFEQKIIEKLGPKFPDSIKQFQEGYLSKEHAVPTNTFENLVETYEEHAAVAEKFEQCKFVDLMTLYTTFQRSLDRSLDKSHQNIL